ncbi:isocitrate/isopropylmalate dehydrogenase family protein [Thermogladius sp. KZ2Tp1]|uniref:isocitrate/isopropylmalate dehydrogenase family protein n=1 Tax=Thermogladius sp. KZ2Tp1 TaxID=3136289 RepID=UPI003DAA3C83
MVYKIGVVRGDGIGPEVVEQALRVLSFIGDFEFVELGIGYTYMNRHGELYQRDFFDVARGMDAVLKGPLYTPWDRRDFRSLNYLIRRELDLYANVRPFESYEGLSLGKFDFTIVRENLEDLYVGVEGEVGGVAVSVRFTSRQEAERVSRFAFEYARREGLERVTLVHKANILKYTDGLLREVFFEVAKEYPDVRAEEVLVDTSAYKLVKEPSSFRVILTPNLYGDILSDLAAALIGGLGLCGSAQIGPRTAVFEPVHGVAFDIAGRNLANPYGMLEATRLLLKYLGWSRGDGSLLKWSKALEGAIRRAIQEQKAFTPDLGGKYHTNEVGDVVLKNLSRGNS